MKGQVQDGVWFQDGGLQIANESGSRQQMNTDADQIAPAKEGEQYA